MTNKLDATRIYAEADASLFCLASTLSLLNNIGAFIETAAEGARIKYLSTAAGREADYYTKIYNLLVRQND
jgi:hypothetical protein